VSELMPLPLAFAPLFFGCLRNLPLAVAPGTYEFNSFTITGGLNSTASDTLGAATFSITVSSPSSVPEPSSLILIASTLIIALIIFVAIAFRESSFRRLFETYFMV
jgi:hypothetical protein